MRCVRRCSISRACCFLAPVLSMLAAVPVRSAMLPANEGDQEGVLTAAESRNKSTENEEQLRIQPNYIALLRDEGYWGRPGRGISMRSSGEPKSGTTWTERIITELAINLCGSSTNTWCQLGGRQVVVHRPAPSYVFEMLHKDTGELFLHFDGRSKHAITGFGVGDNCSTLANVHHENFGKKHPCRNTTGEHTRESLLRCMPDTSDRCAELMPSRNPATLREAIVFRDPRDMVISEHRMRIEVYRMNDTAELNPFIYQRFESKPEALVDLASFMGLDSSLEQVRRVHQIHRNQSPHGTFDTCGLPVGTIKYMNATMSKLLPEEFLARYGLAPLFAD